MTVAECIHGLELDRCDVCSPKPVPIVETIPGVRTVRQPRAAGSAQPRRTSKPEAKLSSIDVGAQRIHHLTHISNLEAILTSGAILAEESAQSVVGLSSEENRLTRRTMVVRMGSESVSSYVPFFLSPDANFFDSVRSGTADPRLAPSIRELPASEFVMLVTTVKAVADLHDESEDASIVVSDRDAAHPLTRFALARDAWERSLRQLIADHSSDAILNAEFLVKESVPFDSISLIGVAHDRARDSVRAVLKGSGFSPRVAVHPPWFAVAE